MIIHVVSQQFLLKNYAKYKFQVLKMILALKKGENRKLVYKLFKAWRRRAILKVKKSSVKRKFKKEIVRYYSVTGNLENLLKIKLLLL